MTEGLDLSGLTDDQIVELARACCIEAISRNPAVAATVREMMLSEAEKARIAAVATSAEIAAARAREREQIALAAAARVRAERAADLARAAQAVQEERERAKTALLDAAAALCMTAQISLLHVYTRHGRRVYINNCPDRFTTRHLVSYDVSTGSISTTRALIPAKADLMALCLRASESLPIDTHITRRP